MERLWFTAALWLALALLAALIGTWARVSVALTEIVAHRDFLDPGVVAFDREAQFYVAYLEFIAPFDGQGSPAAILG